MCTTFVRSIGSDVAGSFVFEPISALEDIREICVLRNTYSTGAE